MGSTWVPTGFTFVDSLKNYASEQRYVPPCARLAAQSCKIISLHYWIISELQCLVILACANEILGNYTGKKYVGKHIKNL